MRLKNWLNTGVVLVQLNFFACVTHAQALLNVAFGSETSITKVGFAATGQSANDYWNLYRRDDGNGGYRTFGTLNNLKWADGTASVVGLTVANAPGAWRNGTADPMYDVYLYPFDGGNITVRMTNLPAGSYDVFLYGHGGPGVDSANSVFKVVSGSSDYGTKATTTNSGWASPVWEEGQQYVVFRDVVVANASGPVTVTVFPGAYGQAFLSGVQLVPTSSSPPPPPPVAAPLLNVDFGVGTSSAKAGFAATGRSANDYWNLYSRDDGRGGYRTFGAVSNLKRADGTVTTVAMTVRNAPGAWDNGTTDPMYRVYLYPFDGGNVTVTMTNLPAGTYDVFLFGHGGPGVDSANSVFKVVSGNSDYGSKATTTTSGWTSSLWQEGQQYVVFRDVAVVNAAGAVTITVLPGAYGQAFLSGMQIVQKSSTPGCVTIFPGLVSWWKGDGNANDATGAHDSTFMSGITFTDGRVGQAFEFNGIDSQVKFGNTVGNFDTNDFTVEFWIRTTATRHESVIEKWPTCGYASMWGIRIGGMAPWSGPGRLEAEMYSDTVGTDQNAISAGRPINDGLFHHVALVRTGTNLVFYIDGVPDVVTNVLSGSISRINNTANLTVGKSVCVGVDGTSPFTGQLDELAVYNRALSASEIQEIYNAGGAGKCPPAPVGPFTNGSFESPALAPGSGLSLPSGSVAITGWRVEGPGMGWQNGASFGVIPVDGAQHIGFNGGNTPPGQATIAQTFTTTVGQSYGVSFNVGRVGSGSGTMSLLAEVTSSSNALLGSLSVVAPDSPGYGPVRGFAFTATTSASTLTFRDTSSATFAVDPLLDNVSVVPIQSCVPPPSGLVSWWPGEGNANDIQHSNNGTLQNGTTFTTGKVGQAFSFDGVDDQVLVLHDANQNIGSRITIDAWVNPSSSGHGRTILQKRSASNVGGYVFETLGQPFGPDNGLQFVIMIGGTYYSCMTTNSVLTLNTWQHVAATYDGSAMRIYVNGVERASTAVSGAIDAVTDPIVIGRNVVAPDHAWQGLIDEVDLFNRALSATEIASIYYAGSAGKCAPPLHPARALAHWKFDEPNGSIALDSAGSYNGTLSSSGASFVSGGVSGGALRLSKANNGFVTMGDVLGLENTDFSIVAWVKMAAGDITDSSVIVDKHAAFTRNGYFLNANKTGGLLLDNRASFIEGGSGVGQITTAETPISTTAVNDGNWHQVVASFQMGGMKSIFVDGAPAEDSKPSQPFNQNSVAFLIGGGNYDGVPTGLFTGLIDEVQIYNYALNPAEVDFLFNNPSLEVAPFDLPSGWTLNTSVAGGGTVQRNPDLARYPTGTNVTLTAVANAGFAFVGWSGDAGGTNNPITLTMDGNKTVTASFREIPSRILAVVNPAAGQENTTITVPIMLTSQGEVGGMSFVLHFDPAYLRDPILRWASGVGSGLNQVGYEIPGQVRATFALPATAVFAGTTLVANISFMTRSVPFTLSTELGLELLDAATATGDALPSGTSTQSGSAQILVRRAIGDNNANNRLDIGDASIIQRLLIGLDPVRSWDVTGNDVNANSRLDSGDVIRVLRVVVGLDPQPLLNSGATIGSQSVAKSGLQKSGPVPARVGLSLHEPSALPGDLVTLQVRLTGLTSSLEGAVATLDYPTNALRLLNAQSQRTGSLVPATALAVWNVAPAQIDYALQSGRVTVAMSSATVWPTNEGVLAELVFQVQPGHNAQYRWPIRVSNIEVTASGYDVQSLADSEIYFIGRDPIPPSLSPALSGWSSNGFGLSLIGESGVAYGIEASSDLVNWSPLRTLTTTGNGNLNFVDPAATNSPQRFYRAKQQ